MLQLVVPGGEYFNELTGEFIQSKPQTLQLEHSLISVSKWEAKWKIPFFSKTNRSLQQTMDYFRCMTVTQNVSPEVYLSFTEKEFQAIQSYIEDPMTATTFTFHENRRGGREIVTSEVIYYWMIKCGIPLECQRWHLNRLLTLIEVYNIKEGNSGKKRSIKDIVNENRSLNASRRAAMNSKG